MLLLAEFWFAVCVIVDGSEPSDRISNVSHRRKPDSGERRIRTRETSAALADNRAVVGAAEARVCLVDEVVHRLGAVRAGDVAAQRDAALGDLGSDLLNVVFRDRANLRLKVVQELGDAERLVVRRAARSVMYQRRVPMRCMPAL